MVKIDFLGEKHNFLRWSSECFAWKIENLCQEIENFVGWNRKFLLTGSTTPRFQNRIHDPQISNQIDTAVNNYTGFSSKHIIAFKISLLVYYTHSQASPSDHIQNQVMLSALPEYTVTGQNGSGQNGTDKMLLDKMVRTKWYRQNGTIFHFVYALIQLNSIFNNQKSKINDKHIEESRWRQSGSGIDEKLIL